MLILYLLHVMVVYPQLLFILARASGKNEQKLWMAEDFEEKHRDPYKIQLGSASVQN